MFRAAEASTKNSLVRVWVEAVFVDPGSLLFGVKTVKVVVDGFVVGGGVVVVVGGFVVGVVVGGGGVVVGVGVGGVGGVGGVSVVVF